MDKEILLQYADMVEERKDLIRRIDEIEKELIEMIEEKRVVSDSVKGTRRDGTYGTIKIEGFPLAEYESKKKILELRKKQLEIACDNLHEMLHEVEKFIEEIPNPNIRIIFRLYYIDNLTWLQVARRMQSMFPKRKYTAESCKQKHYRYLKSL